MRFSVLSALKRFVLSLAVLALVMGVPSMGRAATPEELAWSWAVAVGNKPEPAPAAPAVVSYTAAEGDYLQVCEGGKCRLVRVGAAKASEPQGFAYSEPTTVQGAAQFRPLQRFREWNQSRPKLFSGFRGGFRGGCSSCGG